MEKKPDSKRASLTEGAEAENTVTRAEKVLAEANMPKERGGPKGPEPVRYGDWEVKGICSDF